MQESNVHIPNTARDILLSKVDEFAVQAGEKRLNGAHEDALSLYQRAAEILLALTQSMSLQNSESVCYIHDKCHKQAENNNLLL